MSKGSESVKRAQRNKMFLLRKYRSDKGCIVCGEKHPACLEFHHVDPDTKHQKLRRRYMHGGLRSGGPRWGDMGYKQILEQVSQCVVICSNCHRKENYVLNNWVSDTDHERGSVLRERFLKSLYEIEPPIFVSVAHNERE